MKKLNYFKVSKNIFELKKSGVLTAKNAVVLTYLQSIYSKSSDIIVSQKTIAKRTGIRSVKAVSANIRKLCKLGFISEVVRDKFKPCKLTKPNTYILNHEKLALDSGYFSIPRDIFKKKLSPKELFICFFMSHAEDSKQKISWNSYSEMSKKLKIQKSETVKIIKELALKRLINKMNFIIKTTVKGVQYGKNRYSLLWSLNNFKKRKPPTEKQKTAWKNYNLMRENIFKKFAELKINKQLRDFKTKYHSEYRMSFPDLFAYAAVLSA